MAVLQPLDECNLGEEVSYLSFNRVTVLCMERCMLNLTFKELKGNPGILTSTNFFFTLTKSKLLTRDSNSAKMSLCTFVYKNKTNRNRRKI